MTEAQFEYGRRPRRPGAFCTLLSWLFPRVSVPRVPMWVRDACVVLLMCGVALWLGWHASTNDRGLVIEQLIRLSPAGATVLYWVGAGFMALVALLVGYHTLGNAIVGRRATIELTSESIIVPVYGWSARELRISYEDIRAMSIGQTFGDRSLTIVHPGGKHTIWSDQLPDEESFDTIHKMLTARVEPTAQKDC